MLITFSMFKLSLLTCQDREGGALIGLNVSRCSKLKGEGMKNSADVPPHAMWADGTLIEGAERHKAGLGVFKGGCSCSSPSYFCASGRVPAHGHEASMT